MKALNTHLKLIAIGTFTVMVTIWAGSRMEAKTGQDYTTQSARVSPQIREAAINALGPIGLTRGQTLRIGVLVPVGPGGGPHLALELFDRKGNILISGTVTPGPPSTSSFFDLNADQLPQGEFDNSGRAEIGVTLKIAGDGNGSFAATAQVFDNLTGKSTLALSSSHPGGCN